jgi:hypothetical protein
MNVANRQIGEPYVDRDAPLLLLFQTIGVDPRQSLDERSLAVIDVAGCAGNDSLHGGNSKHGNLNAPAWAFQVVSLARSQNGCKILTIIPFNHCCG